MNVRELELFIAVVDGGSFANAAKESFISPVAVMKHMNSLEEEVGAQLLLRSARGVEPTDAGMFFYQKTRLLLLQLKETIDETKRIDQSDGLTIRVGTSLLKPPDLLFSVWEKIQTTTTAKYNIQLVPFEDTGRDIARVINNLGKDIDVICAIGTIPDWSKNCESIRIGYERTFMAVPKSNVLNASDCISPDDLHGQWVLVTPKGMNRELDEIAEFARDHGASTIEFPNAYDLDAVNYCIKHNALMFAFEYWEKVSPLISTIPVSWGNEMPINLFYPKASSRDVREFISVFKNALDEGTIP